VITGNRCVDERSIGGAVFCEGGSRRDKGTDSRIVLRNCVVAGNQAAFGGGIACEEGAIRLENCIVTNNRALTGKGNQLYIGNSNSGCSIIGCEVGTIELVYSCFDEEIPVIYWDYEDQWGWHGQDVDFYGLGNIAADPLFASAGHWDPNGTDDDPNDDFWVSRDYHLKSQAGRWDPNSESWVQDDVTSPCIDAGDPNSPIGDEPFPNGGRINIGAYGGTAQASKSYFGEPVSETIIAGDINGDGKVDWLDIEILARNWHRDVRK
jgi:hypothetical protein